MARTKKTNEEAELTDAKAASTLQLLFKAARLVDEEALRRIAAIPGRPSLRRSHTALLPHIDLDGTRGPRQQVQPSAVGPRHQVATVEDLHRRAARHRDPDGRT